MPSLSPQVQSYGQVPPAEQAEQMFKDKFTQSAYSVLFSRFADLAPNVVTFKILESDAVEGKAVGAFVALHDNRPVYVPVVMVDGQLKPMEMFYYKDLNIFLPLNNAWLDEISKMSVDEMGEGKELPQDVPKDMSLRNVILPPLVPGRFGYASDMSHDVKKMFKEAFDHHLEIHPRFLDVIKKAPETILDGVKLAFERNPELLQKFAKNYGATTLIDAFRTGYKNAEKVGCAKGCGCEKCKGSVKVFSKKSSTKELKDAFGPASGAAFSEIIKKGYAVKDTRPGIYKAAVKIEGPAILDAPGASGGWFRLYFVDAPADVFFLIPWPKSSNRYDEARCISYGGDRDTHRRPIEYLAINKDGKEAWTCTDVIAGQSPAKGH